MSIENIRPTTLVGVKRLARQISKAEGIPLNRALQRAARAASCENYEHARRVLGTRPSSSRDSHRLFLTSYWTDQKTYERGRETLDVWLSKPLHDLCPKREMRLARALGNMRLAAPDHLVKDGLCPSQQYARDQLCQAVRVLRFMEATGLRPSDYRRAQAATKGLDGDLPENDHSTDWYDPASGQYVLIDEPYSNAVVSAERAEWAVRNNWCIRASSWPGIYFPYRCALFVASEVSSTFDFEKLMRTIDAMPAPVTAERWQGMTASGHTTFTSPLAISAQDKRRAQAKGTVVPRPSKATIPYMRTLIGQARKPNSEMSLADHQRMGNMIKAVLQSQHKPWAANRPLDKLCSTLVDWLYEDVPSHTFGRMDPVDVYYAAIDENDPLLARAESTRGVIELLIDLRELLTRDYPDCEPLRRMTRKIETSLRIAREYEAEQQ